MEPKRMIVPAIALLMLATPATHGAAEVTQHTGMCDASAAVPVGTSMFAVANDEDNVLRVYQRDASGGPLSSFSLGPFLKIDADGKHPEADLEGATRIGSRIYWITSHGANKEGKPRPNRRRLFATEVRGDGSKIDMIPVGTPYLQLVEDLAAAQDLKQFRLAAAAANAPEAKDGLNIEGLSRTPQGGLLIAFRNPIPGGKSLIAPLDNPDEVVNGKPARLGSPILLDLGGLGIRSIEYSEAQRKYFIIAGSYEDKGDFRLYQWSGLPSASPTRVSETDFQGLHPEALIIYPDEKARMQVLSDDGSELVGGTECKDEKVKAQDKQFRSIWISPSAGD